MYAQTMAGGRPDAVWPDLLDVLDQIVQPCDIGAHQASLHGRDARIDGWPGKITAVQDQRAILLMAADRWAVLQVRVQIVSAVGGQEEHVHWIGCVQIEVRLENAIERSVILALHP